MRYTKRKIKCKVCGRMGTAGNSLTQLGCVNKKGPNHWRPILFIDSQEAKPGKVAKELFDMVGTVNDRKCLGAPPGTLMFLGVESGTGGTTLHFQYSPQGMPHLLVQSCDFTTMIYSPRRSRLRRLLDWFWCRKFIPLYTVENWDALNLPREIGQGGPTDETKD